MNENEMRLQKFMALCGVASRRASEEIIERGEVTVNGKSAEIGQKVDISKDKVIYKGERLIFKNSDPLYIMLNKPRGVVSTASDDEGRRTVVSLLKGVDERVYPVGRLDLNSEGLLILTNDGDFAYQLTHPKFETAKGYEVTVSGTVAERTLKRLRLPFVIEGYRTKPAKVSIMEEFPNKTKLYLEIYEGRNRQIRHMCEETGLLIRRLKRISQGSLYLGELKTGTWRVLSAREVNGLLGKNESRD